LLIRWYVDLYVVPLRIYKKYAQWLARTGQLDKLKWAYENGCPIDQHSCIQATICGHTDTLLFLYLIGLPMSHNICEVAIENDSYSIIKCIYPKIPKHIRSLYTAIEYATFRWQGRKRELYHLPGQPLWREDRVDVDLYITI
jgi:hypothetical protein